MDYQKLKNIIDESLEMFKNISVADWNDKPFENKWSKKEILGHLIDSSITNIRRFVVTQYKENENIVYEQDFWVKAQNYQNVEISEVVSLWKFLNYQIVILVENIPDDKLENICLTSDEVTLKFLIEDYIRHMNHHLEAIKK